MCARTFLPLQSPSSTPTPSSTLSHCPIQSPFYPPYTLSTLRFHISPPHSLYMYSRTLFSIPRGRTSIVYILYYHLYLKLMTSSIHKIMTSSINKLVTSSINKPNNITHGLFLWCGNIAESRYVCSNVCIFQSCTPIYLPTIRRLS